MKYFIYLMRELCFLYQNYCYVIANRQLLLINAQ